MIGLIGTRHDSLAPIQGFNRFFEVCKLLIFNKLVGERGFEPPTPWSRTKSRTKSKCFIWRRLGARKPFFFSPQLYRVVPKARTIFASQIYWLRTDHHVRSTTMPTIYPTPNPCQPGSAFMFHCGWETGVGPFT